MGAIRLNSGGLYLAKLFEFETGGLVSKNLMVSVTPIEHRHYENNIITPFRRNLTVCETQNLDLRHDGTALRWAFLG